MLTLLVQGKGLSQTLASRPELCQGDLTRPVASRPEFCRVKHKEKGKIRQGSLDSLILNSLSPNKRIYNNDE